MLALDTEVLGTLRNIEKTMYPDSEPGIILSLLYALDAYNNTGYMPDGLGDAETALVKALLRGLESRGVSQYTLPDKDTPRDTAVNGGAPMSDLEMQERIFSVLWNEYPEGHKRDREMAFKLYARHCRGYTLDEVLRRLRAWINSGDWAVRIPNITEYFGNKKYWGGEPERKKPSEKKKATPFVSQTELAQLGSAEEQNIVNNALRVLQQQTTELIVCDDLVEYLAYDLNTDETMVSRALTAAFKRELIYKHVNSAKLEYYSLRGKTFPNMSRVTPKLLPELPGEISEDELRSRKPGRKKGERAKRGGSVSKLDLFNISLHDERPASFRKIDFNPDDVVFITHAQLCDYITIPRDTEYLLPKDFPEPVLPDESGSGEVVYSMWDVQDWLDNHPELFMMDAETGQYYPKI